MKLFTILVVTISLIALAAPVTTAQPGQNSPADTQVMRSESNAFLLSLAGTAIPLVLTFTAFSDNSSGNNETLAAVSFLGGTIIGPSLGHFYAGRMDQAILGIIIRTVSLVGLVGAFAIAYEGDDSGGAVLAVASLALGAGSMIFDPGTLLNHAEGDCFWVDGLDAFLTE